MVRRMLVAVVLIAGCGRTLEAPPPEPHREVPVSVVVPDPSALRAAPPPIVTPASFSAKPRPGPVEISLAESCGPCCPVDILWIDPVEPARDTAATAAPFRDAFFSWRRCYDQPTEHSVTITLTLAPSGRPKDIAVRSDPPAAGPDACTAAALRQVRWPRGSAAPIKARYHHSPAYGLPPDF